MSTRHSINVLTSKWFLIACCMLLILAVWIRFDQNDDGFNLDEAEYALAAQQGFWANATDSEHTLQQRHYHGPMVSYLIRIGMLIGGEDETGARIFPRFFGALTCVLLIWGMMLIHRQPWMAFTAGFLLAILPTHAHLSGVANMHSLATLLILLCYLFTHQALLGGKSYHLYALAVVLGLLFVTIEYGFVVLLIIGLSFIMVPNSFLHISLKKIHVKIDVFVAIVLLILTLLLFWPAGIFKFHLVKNLLYYLRYSEGGHPILFRGELTTHVPWWAYLYWFGKLAPIWLGLVLSSLGYFLYRLLRYKFQTRDRVLALFTLLLLTAMFRQHIMSARYSAYVLPFLCILCGIFLGEIARNFRRAGLAFGIVVLLAAAITNSAHLKPTVQGDPGYKEAAQYLLQHADPDDRIIAWYQPILRVYLPQFREISNYKRGEASAELMAQLQSNYFRYVLFYHNQVSRWPNDPGLAWIRDNYLLRYAHYFKDEPILWLYEAPVLQSQP